MIFTWYSDISCELLLSVLLVLLASPFDDGVADQVKHASEHWLQPRRSKNNCRSNTPYGYRANRSGSILARYGARENAWMEAGRHFRQLYAPEIPKVPLGLLLIVLKVYICLQWHFMSCWASYGICYCYRVLEALLTSLRPIIAPYFFYL
jgi:hypothetical protein